MALIMLLRFIGILFKNQLLQKQKNKQPLCRSFSDKFYFQNYCNDFENYDHSQAKHGKRNIWETLCQLICWYISTDHQPYQMTVSHLVRPRSQTFQIVPFITSLSTNVILLYCLLLGNSFAKNIVKCFEGLVRKAHYLIFFSPYAIPIYNVKELHFHVYHFQVSFSDPNQCTETTINCFFTTGLSQVVRDGAKATHSSGENTPST